MGDGFLGKCKECTKKDNTKYHRTNRGSVVHRASFARHKLRYPEKRKARVAVGHALRDGRIFKMACWCGDTKSEAHHEDYSKPLDVIWLCNKHHKEADKKRAERDRLAAQIIVSPA